MRRRTFFAAASALLATQKSALPTNASAREDTAMRTITYNILAGAGFPKTRENADRRKGMLRQMPRRIGLELQLYRPDIVTCQESCSEPNMREMASALEMPHMAYFPGGFPGTVVSRWPILEHHVPSTGDETLFTRHVGRAAIDTPLGVLQLFSAHLHPSDDAIRLREAEKLGEIMRPHLEAGDRLLFQGDLNHQPDAPEYALWQALGLSDAATTEGAKPGLTFHSVDPRVRIDYIWTGGSLKNTVSSYQVLYEANFRAYEEDPAFVALSDHLPVMAVIAP